MENREGHYMPASLLASQIAALEDLEDDEPGVVISNEGSRAAVLDRALRAWALFRRSPRAARRRRSARRRTRPSSPLR